MAWNTVKMQAIFDRWAQRRSGAIPPELIARCAPTRTEKLNMRGVFQFLIEQYADALMPSRVISKNLDFGGINLHWRCRKSHGFRGIRNRNEIRYLRASGQKFPGNSGCFYRHFWTQK
jgi:hypothetical protein